VEAPSRLVLDEHRDDRASHDNYVTNIVGNLDDVEALLEQGIELDNEDVLPENNVPPPAPANRVEVGEWKKSIISPRKADNNISDNAGQSVRHRWTQIANR
jgi:hypothetical protein